jgi:N-methylhydantoinase B
MIANPTFTSPPRATLAGRVDPVAVELIQGALDAALQEMAALIDRTAMSAMIKEKKDRFAGLYDAAGRLVGAHTSFTGPGLIPPILEYYPRETLRPGDLFWFNDPFFSHGAIQHLGDMCFITPVFVPSTGSGEAARLAAWSASFGHFKDIGGSRPGSLSTIASEVFHEGTRVPPIRILRAGELNQEAYRVILANSRFPVELEGDSRALMAASRLGEARLVELLTRFGPDTVQAAFDDLIELNAVATRRLLRERVPEGSYSFFDYCDSDGLTERSYRVGMTLTRAGDRITIDLRDSDSTAYGPINFVVTPEFINLLVGRYLMSLDSALLLNEGLLAGVDEVLTHPDTIVQPRPLAATGLRSHTRWRIASCLLGDLNQASGGQDPANSPVYMLYNLTLRDPVSGKLDLFSEGVGSGLGARPTADGVDVIYFIAQENFPIEFVEREHRVQIERYQLLLDSGGPGFHRGGCGVIRDVRLLAPALLRTRMDNVRFPCWGVNGGQAGRGGRILLNPDTPDQQELPPIGEDIQLQAGDLLRIETVGGGGWGDPLTRPVEWVLRDLAHGQVSRAQSPRDYGVVLDSAGQLDPVATRAERARRAGRKAMFDRGEAAQQLIGELESARTTS